MPKKRPAIKPAVIKSRTARTKRTVPRAAKAILAPEVAEPLAIPQAHVADHGSDSGLTIDGSLSAPSYPDVPAVEPAAELQSADDAADSKSNQKYFAGISSQSVVRRTLSISKSLEESTAFTMIGVAVFIGLVICNAGGVREDVSESGFKAAIILFVASLLVGALSKLLGAGAGAGVATVKDLEGELNSTDKADSIRGMIAAPERAPGGLARSFPRSISILLESAGVDESRDMPTPEKIYTRLLFAQIITNLLHWFFGITAILVLAFSMSGRS
jgi:hypothetical protein